MAFLTGVLFVALILLPVILCIPVILVPCVILYFVSLNHSNLFQSYLLSSWNLLIIGIVEIVLRTKLVIAGDVNRRLRGDIPTVIILNHRTRFDWLFLYAYLARLGSLKNHRIIMKSSLKHVPIFGYGLQLVPFIFLNRKWSVDKDYVIESLCYYCTFNKLPVQLVIFPEGTDLTENNRRKDDEYSRANDLPLNEFTLHPRTTGFIQCVQTLRNEWKDKEVDVCDVTASYVGLIPQGEKELAKGDLPKEVHFHVTHYPSSTLPISDEGLAEWLKERWSEKEERLEKFYQTGSFPGPILEDTWRTTIKMIAVMLLWLMICTAMFYCLIQLPLLTAVLLGVPVIVHFIVDKWMDGWDKLSIRKWKSINKTQ